MDAPIDARLFAPGTVATGEAATLTFTDSTMEVRSGRNVLSVPIDSLRMREVVSAHRGIELAWEHRGATHAVHVHGFDAQRRLRAIPALQGTAQLGAVRVAARRSRIGWAVGGTALAIIMLLPLLIVLLFLWQADRIAGAIATRIPVAREEQLGQQVFERMRRTLALRESGPDVELVQAIGKRLTAGSVYHYEFHVARDRAVNAFALPGGIIVVHTGLIDAARRPEEIAGVLAHEIQHVEQRHSLESLVRELGLRGLWSAVTGDMGASLAGKAALHLASLRFSRAAEREADELGFETLLGSDIDPRGMADFFGTMAKDGPDAPAWLSTHPPSEARQQQMGRRARSLGDRAFAPLEPGLWSRVRAVSGPE